MPIDSNKSLSTVSIFVFAHQDDEFSVFQHILDEINLGNVVYCAYLTSGVGERESSLTRQHESVKVLKKLGVKERNILFVGAHLGIPDLKLLTNIHHVSNWINNWLLSFKKISSIFIPAWEGGHPDHDALHAAVLVAAKRHGILHILLQFPLYNSYTCKKPFFRLFNPLPLNGTARSLHISWRNRFKFLLYCFSYKSQYKSWLGLFPFLILHYFIHGCEYVQNVSFQRLIERPHDGALYYENRNFCSWSEMSLSIRAFLSKF